jgi:hypothetical protein
MVSCSSSTKFQGSTPTLRYNTAASLHRFHPVIQYHPHQLNYWKKCVEKKNQLDVTICTLLHLCAQHVSGTSMTIIRSSRLYVRICRLWCAVLGCCLSGVRCRTAGCASRKRDAASIPLPGRTPCCPAPDPGKQQTSTAHHRRQIRTYSLELLMMGI